MSDNYIGNGKEILLLPNNLREDLIPQNGSIVESITTGTPAGSGTSTFYLNTEVPGGSEHQIRVIKRKFKTIKLLENTTEVSIDATTPDSHKIISTDLQTAARLSELNVEESLIISGSADDKNNDIFKIKELNYDPNVGIEIILVGNTPLAEETNPTLSIYRGFDLSWEVLDPENDYNIVYNVSEDSYNQLELSHGLYEEDVAYVLHLSSATYGFKPSPETVGPEQLQQNLRNFATDRFTVIEILASSETTFTLSQNSTSSTTLEVYLDGVLQEGRNYGETVPSSVWELSQDGNSIVFDNTISGTLIIKHLGFSTLPSSEKTFSLSQNSISSTTLEVYLDGVWQEGRNFEEVNTDSVWELSEDGNSIVFDNTISGRLIIKHLGFSTVSRRAAFSQGQIVAVQEIPNNSVTDQKLATNSVTTTKIKDNNVTGSKILLNNNESLRSKKLDSSEHSLLKLNSSDQTILDTPTTTSFSVSGSKKLTVGATSLIPEESENFSLGSLTNKFSDAHFSGDINVDGNINVDGSVDGVDVAALYSLVQDLKSQIEQPGIIKMWAKEAEAPTGWVVCDGRAVDRSEALFGVIGTTFGSGDNSTTFNVPDFRGRFPLGQAVSGTGSSWGSLGRGGSLNHTHTIPAHSHDISHTHTVPGHYHGKGNLSIDVSGGHTTTINIGHSHDSSNTGGYTGNASTINSNYSKTGHALSDSGHNHGGVTGYHEPTHTLQIQVRGGTDPDHNHDNGLTRPNRVASSPESAGTSVNNIATGAIIGNIQNHRHSISSSTSNITLTEPTSGHIHTIPSHTHSFTVPTLATTNRTDTDGTHQHGNSDFSGNVGLTSGSNGDGNITTNSQSLTTSSQHPQDTTGTSNPAYQTIRFIIKL